MKIKEVKIKEVKASMKRVSIDNRVMEKGVGRKQISKDDVLLWYVKNIKRVELLFLSRVRSFLNGRDVEFTKLEMDCILRYYPLFNDFFNKSQRRFKSNKKMFELRSIMGLDVKNFKGVYNTVFLNKESPAAELFRLKVRVDRLENDDIKWMKKIGFPLQRRQIITDYVMWGKDPFAQAVLYQINKIKLTDLSNQYLSERQVVRNAQHVGVVGEKKDVDIRNKHMEEEVSSVSEVRYVNEVNENRIEGDEGEFGRWQAGEEKEAEDWGDILDGDVSEVRGYDEESGVSDVMVFDANAEGKKAKQDVKKRGEKIKRSAKRKSK